MRRSFLYLSLLVLAILSVAVTLAVGATNWMPQETLKPNPLTVAKDAANIVHRSIQQVGFELEARVFYDPEDAPQAIHLQEDPTESYEKRKIRLEAEPKSLWEGNSVLPDPPKADIPIRWYFPSELMELVQVRAKDWDGVYPTLWNKTAEDGVATAYLYPVADQPLGGIREVAEYDVKALALIQAGMGITPWSAVAVASGAAEEMFRPAQVVVPVRIETHRPTRWKGTASIHRSINGFASADSGGPKKVGESRVTHVGSANLWESTLTLRDISLDKEGSGESSYDLVVTGEGEFSRIEKFKVRCDDGTVKTLTDTVERSGSGRGELVGTATVGVKVDPKKGRYALAITGPIGGEIFSPYYFRSSGEEKHSWQQCKGGDKEMTNYWQMPVDGTAGAFITNLEALSVDRWPQFDPDARRYNETISYDNEFRSKDGKRRYVMTTTIQWNLQRVME